MSNSQCVCITDHLKELGGTKNKKSIMDIEKISQVTNVNREEKYKQRGINPTQ